MRFASSLQVGLLLGLGAVLVHGAPMADNAVDPNPNNESSLAKRSPQGGESPKATSGATSGPSGKSQKTPEEKEQSRKKALSMVSAGLAPALPLSSSIVSGVNKGMGSGGKTSQ